MNYQLLHPTRAEISLESFKFNLDLLSRISGNLPLLPAIKANGYGHGALPLARRLQELGYGTMCTAHLPEAIELVENGISASLMILSPTLPENARWYAEYGFQAVVCSGEQVKALASEAARKGTRLRIHIKVDTGMGRVGIQPDELVPLIEYCRTFPSIKIEGVMSHFPKADHGDKSFSRKQIKIFSDMKTRSSVYQIPLFHFSNSAAIFDLPEAGFDAVRPGISIYGLRPSADIMNPDVNLLKPILALKSRITFLKKVPGGTGISYGHIFTTSGESLIATIPVGYGDGFLRNLSGKIDVLVRGARCPQVGRICMDQCMIDVTGLREDVCTGDTVTLIGTDGEETITADELAEKAGTINYEITTQLSARVPRVYTG